MKITVEKHEEFSNMIWISEEEKPIAGIITAKEHFQVSVHPSADVKIFHEGVEVISKGDKDCPSVKISSVGSGGFQLHIIDNKQKSVFWVTNKGAVRHNYG